MSSYAIMTNTGRNKEAEALANGTGFAITEIAWGDGDRFPGGGETALLNEVGRKAVQGTGLVDGAMNTAFFEILLDAGEGPFVIREAGLFDTDGDLIAIARYEPPVNKPKDSVTALIRLHVVFSDLENLILKVQSTDAYVPVERKINAGTGLTGGGDFSENRSLAVAFATNAEAEAGKAAGKVISPAVLASIIGPYTALTGAIVAPGRLVWSSDGALMRNATDANVTITGRDKAALITKGLTEYFPALQAGTIDIASPAGAVMAFAASNPATGWLECNGAAISRAAYPALFAAIGTTYGAGDGSNTFNLPDLRGEFLRGWDHDRGVDAGRGLGTAQSHQTAKIHMAADRSATVAPNSSAQAYYPSTGSRENDGLIGMLGTGPGSETRPRNVAVIFCIKY